MARVNRREQIRKGMKDKSEDLPAETVETTPVETSNGTVNVRVRRREERVETAVCKHCENSFWYKQSHGSFTHNGYYASLRIQCGWCEKPQYLPVDQFGRVVPEPIPSKPNL